MTTGFKTRISNNKWKLIRLFALIAFSALILLNSTYTKSPLVGIPASLVFIYVSSEATGEIFFPLEKRFLKQVLGLASFVLIMALLGTSLILLVNFTETLALLCLVAAGLAIGAFSAVRKREDQDVPKQVENSESGKKESYLLVFPFLLSAAIAFYGLLLSRTSEGSISVWVYIPNFFLPLFFLASLSLVIILFFTRIRLALKLALTSVHSFLAHSVFLLVWYPGRYGDTWLYLGNEVFIDKTGVFYAYDWLYSQRLIADIIKYEAQYGLVVFFRRMFTLDIYWVHVFFIPLLWSLFVPIFFYKIAQVLSRRKTTGFPLFCAVGSGLFSTLIYWGAISAAYSLGLFLLIFSVVLLLEWAEKGDKRILLLAFLASIATLFAHPITGVFSLSFFFVAVLVRSRLHRILKLVLFIPTLVAYPVVSYLQHATFSREGLISLDNLVSFQADMITLLLVFGFLGFLFSIRSKYVNRRSALILFASYAVVAVNYYVSMYGMKGAPVPQRIPTMIDILLIPFAALGFVITVHFLKYGFSWLKKNPAKDVGVARSIALFLVCLLASVIATSSLYQAYPRHEITEVQPSAYELEAILYMDSISEGRYVVLGDTNLAGLAGGFLGIDYLYGASSAKGNFGIPEWNWPNMKLYQQMIVTPSLSILETAMLRTGVGISYFVVSVREPYYEDIVQRTSAVLEANRTFGEGKLTLFRYMSSTAPITGNGPNVKVSSDGGSFTDVQTEYKYFSKSSVKYLVKLSGHSSYNVTDYPAYWAFLDLTVDGTTKQFDDSSDINTFIYVSGLGPENAVEVVWQANDHYPDAGWKEDSFKSGWDTHPGYAISNLSSTVTGNGNILSISGDFITEGEYMWYYQSKKMNNISTDVFPYVLARWRTTAPIASVIVAYTDGVESQVVPYGSDSGDWSVTIAKLEPNKEIAWIIVGITNLPEYEAMGLQTMDVDYVLICKPE